MSNDTANKWPREKLSLIWFGGLLFLPISFLWQFFGPNEPIIVSPKTTYITSPLRHNGLPDYEKYLLDSCREGVTPDNNAVTLLWQAIWPEELEPPEYSAICKEIGISQVPPSESIVQSLDSKKVQSELLSWLRECPRLNADADTADHMVEMASGHPWTSEDVPPLARWITANHKQLDQVVDATMRPRYYAPSPTLLDGQYDPLISVRLPGVPCARQAAISLAVRVMNRVGNGDIPGAWTDTIAIYRLSRLAAQAPTIVEQTVAISIGRIANDAAIVVLGRHGISREDAAQMSSDLKGVAKFDGLGRGVKFDRLELLDALVHQSSSSRLERRVPTSLDWNVALREGNEWYDRLADAVALPTYAGQRQEIARINADLNELGKIVKRRRGLEIFLDTQKRSEAAASIYITLTFPATDKELDFETQENTRLQLTQMAAALALYHATRGSYPQQLSAAFEGGTSVPRDIYNDKPFIYRRTEDGYSLYSCGANGKDDSGSNKEMYTLEGRSLLDLREQEQKSQARKIPTGADDIAIRVPVQRFDWPKPATGR